MAPTGQSEKPSISASTRRDDSAGTSSAAEAPKRDIWSFLPSWVSSNLRSAKSWKLLFKCWLASWAAFILILPNKSLNAMGNAAFFALLSSFFLPPSMPIQLFLMVISTMIVGLLLGWGIGSAGMRAALAARSQVLLRSTLQKAQETAAGSANPDAVFKIEIFQGDFLDARSSVVFGVFLGFGSFVFALLRAYAPSLMFMSIFGTIGLDIFCTFGPLFPFAQYTLLNSLLISTAMYIAIAVFVIIFVFPETMNHAYLNTISDLLDNIKLILMMQEDVLAGLQEDFAPGCPKTVQMKGARLAMIGKQRQFLQWKRSPNSSMPSSAGEDGTDQWPHELRGIYRSQGAIHARRLARAADELENTEDAATTDTYLIQQMYQRNAVAEAQHSLGLYDILPIVKVATADLRQTSVAGIASVKSLIDFVNKNRYHRNNANIAADHDRGLDEATEQLKRALDEFKTKNRLMLLEPYRQLISSTQTVQERMNLPLRGLYVGYVFGGTLIVVAEVILALMEAVRTTSSKRKSNRLWAPKSLRTFVSVVLSKRDDEKDFGEEQSAEDVTADEEEAPYARDPDSRPPTNSIQRVMNSLHHFYAWAKTAKASFVFKYTAVTVLLFLPAVFKSSAHFYYVQKGVWALIMAQTTLNIYAGDQLFNYVVRLGGTFIGLIVGLVVWYIGNGRGHGNRYGVAAAVAVFLVPLVFFRLFTPPQYLSGIVLTCATVTLIVGYSWIDGHLPTVGNPGIGWPVAWKRWVLVVIGCVASFILMMLPPKSGRKAVRLRNASTIAGLSNIYALLMSTWIERVTDEDDTENDKQSSLARSKLVQPFRKKIVAVVQKIQRVQQLTASARWEGNIRGAWPLKEYNRLAEVQMTMVASLAQLAGSLSKLDDDKRMSLMHRTSVINPNFITDVVSIFSLVSQSLRTGEPMHTVLPQKLFDRLIYHHSLVALRSNNGSQGTILIDEVEDLDYMFYATAILSVFQMLEVSHLRTNNPYREEPLR
ncbi:hypothetical protein EW146_g4511 [Bondarzewia mesenterica]|uniref:ER transporter 6TM N-terminal domain-containing protein n=1 Tax=Bondarzewia mesenterica TaxID=1095465 RepID=A0A4S4M033_9AGAM|nr:hypothetical protein EW146_g4511 [Bondarzewia mesenterica]